MTVVCCVLMQRILPLVDSRMYQPAAPCTVAGSHQGQDNNATGVRAQDDGGQTAQCRRPCSNATRLQLSATRSCRLQHVHDGQNDCGPKLRSTASREYGLAVISGLRLFSMYQHMY